MSNNLFFTIAVPTYNRRELLKRNLNHLENLNYNKNKFEIIVVDDGSTDGTINFLKKFSEKTQLNFNYFQQKNGGKYTAVRKAVTEAKGEFFIVNDSDDFLRSSCLSEFEIIIKKHSIHKSNDIAGIIGQNLNLKNNKLLGDKFPKEGMLSDPIEMRFKYNVKGDKINCSKTKCFLEFNFPKKLLTTKFIPESYVYYGICSKYKYVYSNNLFQDYDYQESGLTAKIKKYRIENAYGCFITYERYIQLFDYTKSKKGYLRNYINYLRFAFHSKQNINFFSIWTYILLPVAIIIFITDKKYV